MPKYNGPAADGAAVEAGDWVCGDAPPDITSAAPPQAVTAARPQTAVVVCRILRSAPPSLWAAAAGREARCLSCPAHLSQIPPAVAVIEAPAAGIGLVAGICASRIARDDRDLIAAAYAALQALAPSLRPLGPGGSA